MMRDCPQATPRACRLRVAIPLLLLLVVAVVAAGWFGRRALLTGVASVLISEDPVRPVELIAVSISIPGKGALEAARLYRDGIAPRILVITGTDRTLEQSDIEIWRLGVPICPTAGERDVAILELSGVPRDAIVALADPADGLAPEIDAIAEHVRRSAVASVLFIAARSHTARARWLLREALPPGTSLAIHSPYSDGFRADSWWHTRARSRAVVGEYLHWVNSLLLGDPWRSEKRQPGDTSARDGA